MDARVSSFIEAVIPAVIKNEFFFSSDPSYSSNTIIVSSFSEKVAAISLVFIIVIEDS